MTHDSNRIELPANVLGGAEAVEFSSAIRRLAEAGATKVEVDLQRVVVINSSGLGMLVAAHSTLKKFGASLQLRNVPPKVSAMLSMTHLDEVFNLDSSAESSAGTSR